MKKFLLMSLALLSLVSFAGCSKDAEKAADKIEEKAAEGDTLQLQALEELRDAESYLRLMERGAVVTDANSLNVAIEKLKKSRATYAASRASYQRALDIHADNRDEVKLMGKDSVYKAMSHIDKIVDLIDKKVVELEERKAKL